MSLTPKPFSGGLNDDYPIFLDRLSLCFTDLGLTDDTDVPLHLTCNTFVEYHSIPADIWAECLVYSNLWFKGLQICMEELIGQ